ncbi:MAG: hypothetical protein M0P30_08165 [Syntrophorhabdaceae bacterium]|nr:hypothetical protein [Syntrophorhabdaceae bacterium]
MIILFALMQATEGSVGWMQYALPDASAVGCMTHKASRPASDPASGACLLAGYRSLEGRGGT